MTTKKLSPERKKYLEQIILVWNDLAQFPTHDAVSQKLNLPKPSVRRLIKEARAAGLKVIYRVLKNEAIKEHETRSDNKFVRENLTLKSQLKQLREQLEASHEDAISNERLVRIIRNAADSEPQSDTSWLTYKDKGDRGKSVPVLFLSDLHFDEVVEPSQVEYVNQYNREIAKKRIEAVFNNALDLLTKKLKAKYAGAVVALGGDLLSGNIHDELAESNEATILESVLQLTDLLHAGLGQMVEEFGKLYVPCVVGNHGRIHKKPRAKFKVQQNYEWIIYQLLAQRFANDSRVTFEIPESTDVTFKIHNVTFLLTHGDQFKGGSGISGIFTPLMLGASRKLKRQQAVQKPFDVMMVGHFHSYIHTNSLIVNGTTKGLDEYAYQMNFGFEEPQQALFLVHENHGVTIRMPVLCK
jgi:predicted phosphodiesterase/DNA-directed RNA polymerase subunit H (RpoH/RPB5)